MIMTKLISNAQKEKFERELEEFLEESEISRDSLIDIKFSASISQDNNPEAFQPDKLYAALIIYEL
ncbi:sporulation protein Cse60 [Paenibacillus sp. HN-1]|uniref:sporulation protein Cse60 n=1 Tax=Paenibacillus TaxID=44249 RepID=UPI001CA97042|nr:MULTISPECIES: sporulation protein Cse60 [Paenibacillus]MBY9078291.1 sporulation protein Cse60 [Paenibacillus sp. CGMCC 1.18879]MBY9086050.1 sporulation protein Cse60 [Paenibacillus sinensis]